MQTPVIILEAMFTSDFIGCEEIFEVSNKVRYASASQVLGPKGILLYLIGVEDLNNGWNTLLMLK